MTGPVDSSLTSLVVEGGHRLEGRIDVEGNKNAALPLLAACLLTERTCVLTNVPRIKDVQVMADLLLGLGAAIDGVGTTTLRVDCGQVTGDVPDSDLVGRLRGSVLLCGPLLARLGRVRLAPPGGDFPARRTLSAHLQALEAMGGPASAGERRRLRAGSPRRSAAGLAVSGRSVRDGHRDRPARGGRGPGGERDSTRRLRAARGGAVPVPDPDGGRGRGRRHVHRAHRRRGVVDRGRASPRRGLHRSGQLGGCRGGDRRGDRGPRGRRRRPRADYLGAPENGRRLRRGRRSTVAAPIGAGSRPAESPPRPGPGSRATWSVSSVSSRRRRGDGR